MAMDTTSRFWRSNLGHVKDLDKLKSCLLGRLNARQCSICGFSVHTTAEGSHVLLFYSKETTKKAVWNFLVRAVSPCHYLWASPFVQETVESPQFERSSPKPSPQHPAPSAVSSLPRSSSKAPEQQRWLPRSLASSAVSLPSSSSRAPPQKRLRSKLPPPSATSLPSSSPPKTLRAAYDILHTAERKMLADLESQGQVGCFRFCGFELSL
jgi:hypothetical protein